MEYFREELFPCVSLTAVQTDKFKTGCMTAYLLTQLHRETAAENAVLPYVLRRGTKSLPDMRRISERLDALYGAEIEPSVRKLGEIQAVGFYAGFAEDAFLPGETGRARRGHIPAQRAVAIPRDARRAVSARVRRFRARTAC